MYSNFKEQAIEYVKQAVQEDNAGNYAKAFPLYMNALEYFKTHLQYEKNPKIKEAITQKFTEYLRRVEEIRAVLDDGGAGPASNGDAAVATRPKTKPKDGESGGDGEDPEQSKLRSGLNSAIVREKPNVKWNDVAGLESAKQALQEAVILPVKFPQFVTEVQEERADLVEEDFTKIGGSLPQTFSELLVGEGPKMEMGEKGQVPPAKEVEVPEVELVDVHLRVPPIRAVSSSGEPAASDFPQGTSHLPTEGLKGEGVSSDKETVIKSSEDMARVIGELQQRGPAEMNKKFYQLLNEFIPLWGASADLARRAHSAELELQVFRGHQDSRAQELAEAKTALVKAKDDNKALVDRVTQALEMENFMNKKLKKTLVRNKVFTQTFEKMEQEKKALEDGATQKQKDLDVALGRCKSLEEELVSSRQLAETERSARAEADLQTKKVQEEVLLIKNELSASKQRCETLTSTVQDLEGQITTLNASLPQVKLQGARDFLAMEGPSQKVFEAFVVGFYKCRELALADPSQLPILEVPTVNTLSPEVQAKVEEMKPNVVSLLQYFRSADPDLLATWDPPSSEVEGAEEDEDIE